MIKGDILLFVDRILLIRQAPAISRTARALVGGICYHVINRGNARAEIFRKPEDYAAFLALLRDA